MTGETVVYKNELNLVPLRKFSTLTLVPFILFPHIFLLYNFLNEILLNTYYFSSFHFY